MQSPPISIDFILSQSIFLTYIKLKPPNMRARKRLSKSGMGLYVLSAFAAVFYLTQLFFIKKSPFRISRQGIDNFPNIAILKRKPSAIVTRHGCNFWNASWPVMLEHVGLFLFYYFQFSVFTYVNFSPLMRFFTAVTTLSVN